MSDVWDYYFATVNDASAVLFVDLGIRDNVPDPKRGWLMWTWVYLRKAGDDGLSNRHEASRLHEIEDALGDAIRKTTRAELVGYVTTAGRREFYFYGRRPTQFDQVVADAMHEFPEYRFDLGTKDDSDWAHYLDNLYPTPEDFQQIANRHLLETLEQEGDRFAIPRPVTHSLDFASTEKRDEFAAQARIEGFDIVQETTADAPAAPLPYRLVIERTDAIEWGHINEVTIHLFQLARDYHGEYDGWETSVESD